MEPNCVQVYQQLQQMKALKQKPISMEDFIHLNSSK